MSIQEVIAHEFFIIVRYTAADSIVERQGHRSGLVPNHLYPYKDDWVRTALNETHQFHALGVWMADERLRRPEFETREGRNAAEDLINGCVAEFTQKLSAEGLTEGGLRLHLPISPTSLRAPSPAANVRPGGRVS